MATTAEPLDVIRSRIEEVDVAEARDEIAAGDAVLIDTREQHEWDEAHLEGATLVRPAEVTERIAGVVPDRSRRVLVYCATGNRSARATDAMTSELGYTNVANIAGGIEAWQELGLPVVAPQGMTREQRMRYSRHTLLPEIGGEGPPQLLH